LKIRIARILTIALAAAGVVLPFFASASPAPQVCRELFVGRKIQVKSIVDGIRYKILGEQNAKTLVLLHGMGGSLESFKRLAPYLANRGFKVITYDMRGHGESPAKGDDYSTHAMADDLASLLDHLGVEKTYIIGHSMGGRVAARFAAEHPEQVEGLVVEDIDLIRRASPSTEKQRRALVKAAEVRRRLLKPYNSKEEYLKAIEPFFNGPDLESIAESLIENEAGSWIVQSFPPDVYSLFWNQGNQDNILDDLGKTNVRTLLVRADSTLHEVHLTDEGIRQAKEKIPSAKIIEIAGAGHSAHQTKFKVFVAEILKFFAD
jgi:pimeloyl-ACP methyl ester carboxylesterase